MRALVPLLLLLAPPQQDYEQATASLDQAIQGSVSEEPAVAIEALEAAIEASGAYPGEAPADGSVPQQRLVARVILIRLHLALGDQDAARAVMDSLIRMVAVGGEEPPVRSYGREVSYLYEDRKTALEAAGTGTLAIDCEVPCEVVLDERRLTDTSAEALLGPHRVWIRASDAAPGSPGDWTYQEVELAEAGATQTLVYEDPAPPPEPEPEPPPPPPPPPKRLLPRAAEIAGAAAGVGLLVAGAVLLSFDNKCSETNAAPTEGISPSECGDIYESSASGLALIGVGGGLLVVSGVLLTVDEVRVGRARGRQVMLGASFRF